MKDIVPLLFRSGGIYFDKNKKILENQVQALEAINGNCFEEYREILGTVTTIKMANEATHEEISKILAYSDKINVLSEQIDDMEKEEEALELHITKLEAKYKELETIKKYIHQVQKPIS